MYVKGRSVDKDFYRYKIDWFNGLWRSLPKMSNKYPDDYKIFCDILKSRR